MVLVKSLSGETRVSIHNKKKVNEIINECVEHWKLNPEWMYYVVALSGKIGCVLDPDGPVCDIADKRVLHFHEGALAV